MSTNTAVDFSQFPEEYAKTLSQVRRAPQRRYRMRRFWSERGTPLFLPFF